MRAPIGATGMGRHGAKKRAFENGQSSATPSPPFVLASSRGWLTATAMATIAARRNDQGPRRASAYAVATPARAANASECVAPRCPNGAE